VTAAIYARKSTDQSGISDEQRSVARQVEHARGYAARKGWQVLEEHVYVDDGISGAEFANRPGFLQLMNALKPRAAFQALIMSEESRLGREAIETAYALKQLVQAGVRVFFYLEDRERTLDSPTDKVMLPKRCLNIPRYWGAKAATIATKKPATAPVAATNRPRSLHVLFRARE
jgi:DNA invertase Pin-like site-specific DNA recombinase